MEKTNAGLYSFEGDRMKKLVIVLPEADPIGTVEEVLRLFSEGYTSGINPTWEIQEHGDRS